MDQAAEGQRTPGPWTLDAGKHRTWVCTVGNNPGDPSVWSEHKNEVGVPFPYGDKLADARLIAAAPDMLKALQAVEALMMSVAASKDAALSLVLPAIAKASGKSDAPGTAK